MMYGYDYTVQIYDYICLTYISNKQNLQIVPYLIFNDSVYPFFFEWFFPIHRSLVLGPEWFRTDVWCGKCVTLIGKWAVGKTPKGW